MNQQRLVVHFTDGRVVKGHTSNFSPTDTYFVLHPPEAAPGSKGVTVEMTSLKAIFFVKDFTGQPQHVDKKEFASGGSYQGRKARVAFADGEVMVGFVAAYDPHALGFFLFPADNESNTIKVFALNSRVREVLFL